MHKIDSANATGENEFQDGNAVIAQRGTIVVASWLNTIQRELVKIVEESDLTLDANDDTQVFQALEIFLKRFTPVGIIQIFGATTAPSTTHLKCDGAAVSRSVYSDLFAVIGTTYGIGDGSTTFNLPDFTAQINVSGTIYMIKF